MNLIEKFLADTEGMHLYLPEAGNRRAVYLFLGRASLLVVSREGNRILHQVPLTLTVQILGPSRFAFAAEGQQLIFEVQDAENTTAPSDATTVSTDKVVYGGGTATTTTTGWTASESPSQTFQGEPYPHKAQCDRCKSKKRCANYDVVNGKQFQTSGGRELPTELHAEYDQYCAAKIKSLNCLGDKAN